LAKLQKGMVTGGKKGDNLQNVMGEKWQGKTHRCEKKEKFSKRKTQP